MKHLVFLFAVLILFASNVFSQEIPKQISYQGVLKDAAGNNLTGSYSLVFSIYNEATGGTALWTETQDVTVSAGLFSVQLGTVTPITTVPFNRIHFLGITVGTGSEQTPRTLLSPSPYSFMAMNVMDNVVTAGKIQDGAVNGSKIAGNEVVKSLNGLKDGVNLIAGTNVTITPSGNSITIDATPSTGGLAGSGTANYIPRFTAPNTLGNSQIFQSTANNIGIGTSAPQVKLSLGTDINAKKLAIYDGASDFYGFGCQTGRITFYTNNTEKMTLLSNGNLGIGVSSPQEKLHVKGFFLLEGSDLYMVEPTRGNGGRALVHWGTNTNDDKIIMNFNGDFEEGVQIQGSKLVVDGSLGVGTSTPPTTTKIYAVNTNGNYGRMATSIDGVVGYSNVNGGYAFYGIKGTNASRAGYFSGDVTVAGNLTKTGGSFKIDHPLDPTHKNLYHSFVESPDMMNIYNGNVTTDGSGYATVGLPNWFEALNKDFRYQLTVIGDFAEAIIFKEVQNNQFSIRTDKPNVKVSWQVTGIRKDPWAEKNRIPVEETKPKEQIGKYLHPEVYGVPESMGVDYERIQKIVEGK